MKVQSAEIQKLNLEIELGTKALDLSGEYALYEIVSNVLGTKWKPKYILCQNGKPFKFPDGKTYLQHSLEEGFDVFLRSWRDYEGLGNIWYMRFFSISGSIAIGMLGGECEGRQVSTFLMDTDKKLVDFGLGGDMGGMPDMENQEQFCREHLRLYTRLRHQHAGDEHWFWSPRRPDVFIPGKHNPIPNIFHQ